MRDASSVVKREFAQRLSIVLLCIPSFLKSTAEFAYGTSGLDVLEVMTLTPSTEQRFAWAVYVIHLASQVDVVLISSQLYGPTHPCSLPWRYSIRVGRSSYQHHRRQRARPSPVVYFRGEREG